MPQLNGIDIVRGVYRRLRRPSQAALPWQDVLQIVSEVISRLKGDLAMSPQNLTAQTSDWFIPSSTDFPISELGLSVLLPIRLERRGIGSEFETGFEVPTVNYEVLNTSNVGAVSYYGDPLRIVFRDPLETVSNTEYRLIYESDTVGVQNLNSVVGLPQFFKSYAILLSGYEAMEIVVDDSDKWEKFVEMFRPSWNLQIIAQDVKWQRFIREFRGGKSQIPKRTFLDNRRGPTRTRWMPS
jgi:hypothetical protein